MVINHPDRPVPFSHLQLHPCDSLTLSPEILSEINEVASCTFRFLYEQCDPTTSLPYDRVIFNEGDIIATHHTSPTNIACAILSLYYGVKLELLTEVESSQRISQILNTLRQIPRDRDTGLFFNWYQTNNGQPIINWPGENEPYQHLVSSVDNAWLLFALIFIQNNFPESDQLINDLINEMKLDIFYHSDDRSLNGHYDPKTRSFSKWRYGLDYLSESRIAYYILFLSGKLPLEKFNEIMKKFPTKTFGGAMFEAIMPGIFIDEGESVKESIEKLIQQQKTAGSQHGLWGFSPCDGDAGYREFGIEAYAHNGFSTITPHALMLALRYAPEDTLEAIIKLSSNYDIWHASGYGFIDGINLDTGNTSNSMLYLDQSMIFLMLVNILCDDCIRADFQSMLNSRLSAS